MKRNAEVYKITSTAFLMALAILFSRIPFLSTYINIGGYNLVKIGFQEVPLMIVCLYNGPLYSLVCSFVADLLAATIFPTGGAFFPGFTLDAMILGLIPSLYIKSFKGKKNAHLISFISFLCIVFSLSVFFISKHDKIKIGSFSLEINILWKMFIIFLLILISILFYILFSLDFPKKRKGFFINRDIFMCFFIRDVLLAPVLVPIWLDILYSVPYGISYFSQLISKMITLPILCLITILVSKPLERVTKNLLLDTYEEKNIFYNRLINGKKIS